MTQLWLVPVDEASFQRTLVESIDLSEASDKPRFPDEARVWGVRTDPEQGSWERNRRISIEWSGAIRYLSIGTRRLSTPLRDE